MTSEADWEIQNLEGSHVANVTVESRSMRQDDRTGRTFEMLKIGSPSTHLGPGKYRLLGPDGDKLTIQIFDNPVGGVYTAGKIADPEQ